MSSNDVVISVRNITKKYRIFNHPGDRIKQTLSFGYGHFYREFSALSDISFDIKKGSAVGIIGRNGSGKSTLLQLICGILKPTSGSVVINGSIAALLELGAGFDGEFTGRENIYFQGALMGLSKIDIDARFEKIETFADIGRFIDQPVRTYSSGMYVRLAFANMIHVDSDIIIIDEALAVGDEEFKIKCFSKLQEYLSNNEKVVILVSHSSQQIEQLCNYVLWLDKGVLMDQGEAKHICDAYQADIKKNKPNECFSKKNIRQIVYNSNDVDIVDLFFAGQDKIEAINTINTQSPINIVIEFISHIDLKNPKIFVGFHNDDSVAFIASASTENIADDLYFPKGHHRIFCLIPNLLLLPNNYQLRLIFKKNTNQVIWSGHALNMLRVTSAPEKNARQASPGYIDMPFEWSVAEIDNA
jgi:ABC-type polysaccharide/polyol phosphate transport system ATPase subunit